MKRIPLMYKTEEVEKILSLSTRSDKRGNVYHCVTFGEDYVFFKHLSSAMDYIQSNFKSE